MTVLASKFPKQRLKEVSKKLHGKEFRLVKAREEMKVEGERRKEKQMASVTPEDIAAEMLISVEERVTPYHHLTYKE